MLRSTENPESRLFRLERRSQLLSICVLILGLVLLVSAFHPGTADTWQGKQLEIVDEEGRVRAKLGIDEEGSAGLFLHDSEKRLRASFTHDEKQTALYLYDAAGTIRVGTAQFAHGGGGYALHGPESKGAAVLYLKGKGSLSFFDAEGKVIDRTPK